MAAATGRTPPMAGAAPGPWLARLRLRRRRAENRRGLCARAASPGGPTPSLLGSGARRWKPAGSRPARSELPRARGRFPRRVAARVSPLG